jgi:putative glutamine amidotransferase
MNTPLLIGLSARIYTPGSAGVDLPGVWTKTCTTWSSRAAHWVMSGGALAVMVPPCAGALPGEPVSLATTRRRWTAWCCKVATTWRRPLRRRPAAPRLAGRPLRDRYEMALIRAFVAAGKPVFGICRGLQLLNVCFGGTLLQDIAPSARRRWTIANWAAQVRRALPRVEFVPGTHLASLYPGMAQATTNSIHHQGIKDLAPGFVVEARCPEDGLIEAVRRSGPGFVAGVQWHPEFHRPTTPPRWTTGPSCKTFCKRRAPRRTLHRQFRS